MTNWWETRDCFDQCYICGDYPHMDLDGPIMLFCVNCGENFVEEDDIVTAVCEWNKEQRRGKRRVQNMSETTELTP